MPLEELPLQLGERTWSILHTGAIISRDQETAFPTGEATTRRPYGVVLWPAAIALAHGSRRATSPARGSASSARRRAAGDRGRVARRARRAD